MLNAGVPGYVSDQWMLYSERELAEYRPDIVILYAGWNDFQSYNPHVPPPTKSHFNAAYGYLPGPVHALRSVSLLGALLRKIEGKIWKPEDEVSLDSDNLEELEGQLWSLKKELRRSEAKLQKLEAEADKDLDKIERRKKRIDKVKATIAGVEARIAELKTARADDPNFQEQREIDRLRATYRFFFQNLDRTVAAFQAKNKDVRVVVSTLVGRWPYESESYFEEGNNSVWWMRGGADDSKSAHQRLERFNELIREHVREKGWVLIDAAKAFENARREEIQWDFAHFTDVGYRMLAETIYKGLVEQGVVD